MKRLLQRTNEYGETVEIVRELLTDNEFAEAQTEVDNSSDLVVTEATGKFIIYPVDDELI